ncbi:hypothetical protein WT08_19335 [Burkholderia sp. MSMB1552]|nr:hypothetical protein WT08_19335 [Burkholderia sp. MSMB1552]KWZ50131.1 hypothetical protein WS92_22065 [Burkholderia sp. MSMB1588]
MRRSIKAGDADDTGDAGNIGNTGNTGDTTDAASCANACAATANATHDTADPMRFIASLLRMRPLMREHRYVRCECVPRVARYVSMPSDASFL